jgi:hypothetical protein
MAIIKEINIIDGIRHEKFEKSIDYINMKKVEVTGLHTFGTVYVRSNFGYVANGYHWYRFRLSDLPQEKKKIIFKYL